MNILDKKATLTAIRAIKKTDGNLRDKIQTVAISALAHAGEHGDTGLMSKLVLAVNASTATQLRKYFTNFAPVVWNKGKGTFTKAKKGGAYRVSDADSVNWYDELEAKKAASADYDTDKTVKKAIKQLETLRDLAEDNLDIATAIALETALTGLRPVELKVAA